MRTAKLRQSGGAVIVTLPKPYLERLGLGVDAPVNIDVVDEKIVITRQHPGRVGLAARLAMCRPDLPITVEEREWLDAPAVGKEII